MMFFAVLGFYLLLRGSKRGHPGAAEVGAGAAFLMAVAIKASAGILLPVVLAGLLRTPRRLVTVLLGMAAAVALIGAASLVAFGLHIPDLSTQGSLVTNESVPNLLGLALGAGGETETLRLVMSGVLVASLLLCGLEAWRRPAPEHLGGSARSTAGSALGAAGGPADRLLTASGWANVALLVTLSWVLPWYVLWVLPFAALSTSRRLRVGALVLGVYLVISWAPASGLLWNQIGFYPEKTPLGRLHQRYVRELLD
jgi:hypothetical protein